MEMWLTRNERLSIRATANSRQPRSSRAGFRGELVGPLIKVNRVPGLARPAVLTAYAMCLIRAQRAVPLPVLSQPAGWPRPGIIFQPLLPVGQRNHRLILALTPAPPPPPSSRCHASSAPGTGKRRSDHRSLHRSTRYGRECVASWASAPFR